MTLLAVAAERAAVRRGVDVERPPPAAVDRYLLPARRSAANPPQRRAEGESWDRQTDGRVNSNVNNVGNKIHCKCTCTS